VELLKTAFEAGELLRIQGTAPAACCATGVSSVNPSL
jgi:hypothetical protein